LKSIRIPASVEVLCSYYPESESDDYVLGVNSITFEKGSKLREIKEYAFYGYCGLNSICLPASVELIDGSSFMYSSLREISIESENPFIRVKDSFIVDFAGVRLIRYFGHEDEVTIGKEIETLGYCSFRCCAISHIRFELVSQRFFIEKAAFAWCRNLQSISIPGAVTVIDEYCFDCCNRLAVVTLPADSRLVSIGASAFRFCALLKSIDLPPTLEIIGDYAFFSCSGLETVTISQESKLVRMEARAFDGCDSLQSLFLPPLLEFVGGLCFHDALQLSSLTFSLPSRLRELLDVPRSWPGLHAIPDTVEVLQLCRVYRDPGDFILTFSRESRLREVRITSPVCCEWYGSDTPLLRYFLQVSSRSVKLFRANLEFPSS
jgi:hypothetical protein